METQLQDDRQYTIDGQMVNRPMMSKIQRYQLAISLFGGRRLAWISYRLLNFYNCI